MVKELRERTGVGMGKCKEALDLADGDMEKAIDHSAQSRNGLCRQKRGRETKEGMIGVAEGPHAVALIEVNAETDFVDSK